MPTSIFKLICKDREDRWITINEFTSYSRARAEGERLVNRNKDFLSFQIWQRID